MPQASIPLPSNDPVTISSPSGSGFVIVTGGSEAVPNGATILASVSASSSSTVTSEINKMAQFLSLWISTSYASTCSSELPECPEINADHQCQNVANSDGSFLFSVPASVTDVVRVNYLNLSTCQEVEAYSLTVGSGTMSLSIEALAMAIDEDDHRVFILGTVDGVDSVFVVSTEDGSLIESFSPSLTGTAADISHFQDHNGYDYLVLQTDESMFFGKVEDNQVADSDWNEIVSLTSHAVVSGLEFRAAQDFTYPLTSDVDCFSSFTDGKTYTRLFFTDNNKLYILDDIESGIYGLREVTLVLSDYPTAAVANLPHVAALSDTFVVVVGFSSDSSETYSYYAIEISNDSGFCSSNLQLSSEADRVYLGLINSDVYTDGFGDSYISVLKSDSQSLMTIDAQNVLVDGTITLDSAYDHYDDLYFSRVMMVQGVINSNSLIEYLLVGTGSSGAGFIVEDNSASAFGNGFVIDSIGPVAVDYDSTLHKIILLDAGIDSDDLSNLILHDLD